MGKLGTSVGLLRFATITKFNSNGTVRVSLDEGRGIGSPNEFDAPIPAAWEGPNGEFIGGYPETGASIVVGQGKGGQWFVVGYVNSNDVFTKEFVSSGNTLMSALRPGRALMQANSGNRIFADPKIGMQIGNAREFAHIDPSRGIFSHNIDAQMSFTESGREIRQVIKRDLSDNASRNVLGSTLSSQSYDDQLRPVCLDPTTAQSRGAKTTRSAFVRNPPLVENREVVYEFADSYRFTTDEDEGARYNDPGDAKKQPDVSRRQMRSDALSLSLEYPNHLIETIKGTAVDAFGNILDLNRNPLSIGREDKTSIRKSADKQKAFALIRAAERKSIAFHWELNARKGEEKSDGKTLSDVTSLPPPDPKNNTNYGRSRSRLFVDIDKEGQFKINVPASSETGNIPLLTRYENYSVVLGRSNTAAGEETDPNEFARNEKKQEIFVNDFAVASSIEVVSGEDSADANVVPNDWIASDNPTIKFGTAHHDITKVCTDFTINANWYKYGRPNKSLVSDPIHPLNQSVTQLDKIVSDTITVSGPSADAGGRSGVINFDGWVGQNYGANTIDRQSLWMDTAGGVVSHFGRDRQDISLASSFDGDVFIEIGGAAVGSTIDSRFANQNNAFRAGALDIRILNESGMSTLLRIDSSGISLATPGRLLFWADQDIILKSVRGDIKMEAENIMMYSETTKRVVNRNPAETIG
ncbi:MAG: hypothetical protein ACXADB_07195 [Candidatus Hermodarchaeia archaeon]|jgi:hypothetical protein